MTEQEFLTVPEAAAALNISNQRLRLLCSEGRVRGATQVGRFWRIPAPPEIVPFLVAETGLNEELLTAAQAAQVLGLSRERVSDLCRRGRIRGAVRAGRNWAIPNPPEILPGQPRGHPRREPSP